MKTEKPLRLDITGKQYGMLSVIRFIGVNKNGSLWECKCECGNTAFLSTRGLQSGDHKSCGCQKNKPKHGFCGHPLWETWKGMMRRCYNAKVNNYYLYGARGITVCKRWHNFALFIEDVSPKPAGYFLDRINNNGNYCPENCRWVTPKESSRNRRDNRWITINGEKRTIKEWIEQYGINSGTFYKRLKKGQDVLTALTTPINTNYRRQR